MGGLEQLAKATFRYSTNRHSRQMERIVPGRPRARGQSPLVGDAGQLQPIEAKACWARSQKGRASSQIASIASNWSGSARPRATSPVVSRSVDLYHEYDASHFAGSRERAKD